MILRVPFFSKSAPYRVITVPTKRGQLRLAVVNKLTAHRAKHIAEKEPGTTEWVDGFKSGSTFWDVGANIGAFTCYSSLDPTIRALAFEPGAVNHFLLAANIELNDFGDRVSAFCMGFAGQTKIQKLKASQEQAGKSFAVVKPGETGDFCAETFLCYRLDDFAKTFGLTAPNYLKIDVPTVTGELLAGAQSILSQANLRELMVELDEKAFGPGEFDQTLAMIARCGLSVRSIHRRENRPTLADYWFVRE